MSPILESIGSVKGFGWGALLASSSFESIATVTAAGGETSLTFSSIAGTYKSLQIRGIMRASSTGTNLFFRLNSVSSYTSHRLKGNGTTASAAGQTGRTNYQMEGAAGSGTGASMFGVFLVDIIDYASTSKNKTIRSISGLDDNSGATSSFITLNSALADGLGLTAVTSIVFTPELGTFSAGTTLALYGIKG